MFRDSSPCHPLQLVHRRRQLVGHRTRPRRPERRRRRPVGPDLIVGPARHKARPDPFPHSPKTHHQRPRVVQAVRARNPPHLGTGGRDLREVCLLVRPPPRALCPRSPVPPRSNAPSTTPPAAAPRFRSAARSPRTAPRPRRHSTGPGPPDYRAAMPRSPRLPRPRPRSPAPPPPANAPRRARRSSCASVCGVADWQTPAPLRIALPAPPHDTL